VLDCCHSGAVGEEFRGGDIDSGLGELARRNAGTYILTASTAIELAEERESAAGDGTSGNGIFTRYFIEALETGNASSGDSDEITIDAVHDYIKQRVTSQRPQRFVLGGMGRFVVGRSVVGHWERRRAELFTRFRELLHRNIISDEHYLAAAKIFRGSWPTLSVDQQSIGRRALDVLDGKLSVVAFCSYLEAAAARLAEPQSVAVQTPATPPPQAAPSGVVPLSPDRERALKPKDVFKEFAKGPEMVVVPAGSFTMGSPAREEGRFDDEGPQHTVTIGRPFAVGRFAVTFDEWDACVADGGGNGHKPSDQGWGRGRRPVINVSWEDATAYAAWLSRKTGKTYRLLSEAEWEYVARAGTTTPFWWGASISPKQANYDGNYTYGNGPKGEYRQRTLPVDSFDPNPWGLYQVHGNVWEWTQDCWNGSYAGAPSDGSAWTTGDCGRRVVRGGSWKFSPQYLRSACRSGFSTDFRVVNLGFRVGRTLTP
jgi:formylglycine-generating enzyme required for sulfatase activity